MLQNIKELYGNKLAATDGDIGRVKDFYFDDKSWVIRYVVADTEAWLAERQVLLSPHAFGRLVHDGKLLLVNLSRKQIENSPSLDLHQPVSRQHETEYHRYYGWPAYWEGGALWGLSGYPEEVRPPSKGEREAPPQYQHRDDKHLRSTRAVTGYHIQTEDGAIGRVSGFLVDDRTWAIRELAVETGHWYAGKEILIAPDQVERISHEESKVFVSLTKEDIQRTGDEQIAQAGAGDYGAQNIRD